MNIRLKKVNTLPKRDLQFRRKKGTYNESTKDLEMNVFRLLQAFMMMGSPYAEILFPKEYSTKKICDVKQNIYVSLKTAYSFPIKVYVINGKVYLENLILTGE